MKMKVRILADFSLPIPSFLAKSQPAPTIRTWRRSAEPQARKSGCHGRKCKGLGDFSRQLPRFLNVLRGTVLGDQGGHDGSGKTPAVAPARALWSDGDHRARLQSISHRPAQRKPPHVSEG